MQEGVSEACAVISVIQEYQVLLQMRASELLHLGPVESLSRHEDKHNDILALTQSR